MKRENKCATEIAHLGSSSSISENCPVDDDDEHNKTTRRVNVCFDARGEHNTKNYHHSPAVNLHVFEQLPGVQLFCVHNTAASASFIVPRSKSTRRRKVRAAAVGCGGGIINGSGGVDRGCRQADSLGGDDCGGGGGGDCCVPSNLAAVAHFFPPGLAAVDPPFVVRVEQGRRAGLRQHGDAWRDEHKQPKGLMIEYIKGKQRKKMGKKKIHTQLCAVK